MSPREGGFDARRTYDDASQDYDDASRDYWQFLSVRAVELAALQAGDHVLDVPCGAGPSAISAATIVGPRGHVLGIDFAPKMLEIAAAKVADLGLDNIELRVGDMTSLGLAPGSFDAVICVLGVFFVDDMPGVLRGLRDVLRPDGGRLVVAVIGREFFSPMRDVFVDAVASVRPDIHVAQPWRRTEDPLVLRGIFTAAGIEHVEVRSGTDRLRLPAPDDWWRIVVGTGLRSTVVQLAPDEAQAVRRLCDDYIRERSVHEVVFDTHIARTPPLASRTS